MASWELGEATLFPRKCFLGSSSRNGPPIHGSTQASLVGAPPHRDSRSLLPPFAVGSTGRFRDTAAPVVQLMPARRSALRLPAPLLQAWAPLRSRCPAAPREGPGAAAGPVLSRSQCLSRLWGVRLPLRGVQPWGWHGVQPLLPAPQRARAQGQAACGPTALRFLSATRPAAAPSLAARPAAGHWPAVLFYIGRPGPIGAQHLLNMHAGHQSASAGAGPPRAVAKLGLLNCY